MRGRMRNREIQITVFWFVCGWIAAAVAANRLFAAGWMDEAALYQRVAEEWNHTSTGSVARLCRILAVRLSEFGILWVLCRSRMGRAAAWLAAAVRGMTASFSLVLFTWNSGWLGLPQFLRAGFPHEGFYLMLMALILVRGAFRYPMHTQKFRAAAVILFALGAALEYAYYTQGR